MNGCICFLSMFPKKLFLELDTVVSTAYKNSCVYPEQDKIFRALHKCAPHDINVVILGQDPYHGENEAMGLAFSVPEGVRVPPSLRNIFKEIENDMGYKPRYVSSQHLSDSYSSGQYSGDLTRWAEQGVLLLNSVLTVEKDLPNSHQNLGWQKVTDAILHIVSDSCEHVVFILWGAHAHKKKKYINEQRHLIIESAHPSPLSAYRGFFGSKPFSKANAYLAQYNKRTIDWR